MSAFSFLEARSTRPSLYQLKLILAKAFIEELISVRGYLDKILYT